MLKRVRNGFDNETHKYTQIMSVTICLEKRRIPLFHIVSLLVNLRIETSCLITFFFVCFVCGWTYFGSQMFKTYNSEAWDHSTWPQTRWSFIRFANVFVRLMHPMCHVGKNSQPHLRWLFGRYQIPAEFGTCSRANFRIFLRWVRKNQNWLRFSA